MTDPIMVQVVRNDFVESVHRARVVITEPDGSISRAWGEVEAPMFPRSAVKPLQAVGMLRAGLDLDGAGLALAGASHSGELFHLDAVRGILAGAGLDDAALQNTPDLPLDDVARDAWLRDGGSKTAITQNCSGKHAAMLRTSVGNDWPTRTYRDHDHPLQRGLRRTLDDLTGTPTSHPAVDGCGAPLYAMPLVALARAFGRLASATDGPERQVAQAFRDFPDYASGTRRDEAALHRAVDGLVCKAGAEGVYAVGLPDGRGVAVKISDGTPRARAPLMAAVLLSLGLDHPTLHEQSSTPVLGHGQPVGAIRAVDV